MRVAFLVPDKIPSTDYADALFDYTCNAVHQGIGYVAAFAQYERTLDKYEIKRTSEITDKELDSFLDQGWDVIGITLTIFAHQEVAHLCDRIKLISHAKVVLGGPEVTTIKEDVLRSCAAADYAVYGEGEITFCELLDCIRHEGDFRKIRGLIYRDPSGTPVRTSPREFADNLSIFPHPDRSAFKYSYSYHSIIGTRGCPYRCNFCNSSHCWGYRYRMRDPVCIYDEIRYITDLYGKSKIVIFDDDSFNINDNWVKSVCKLITELKVSWRVRGIRAGLVNNEVADSLVESGCIGVSCGVESADNDSLRAMRKGSTIEEILNGVAKIQEREIPVVGNFMIGNIGDTLETVRKSIEYAALFSQADFRIVYPMPYTDLYDYLKANDLFLCEPIPIKYGDAVVGRILFETPTFPVKDRIEAANMVLEAKLLYNVCYGN